MSFELKATTASADAPHIDPAVYDAVAINVIPEAHPEWAGIDDYGKQDTGDRYRWFFQPFDGDKPVYDEGDRVIVNALTNTKLNPNAQTKSKGIRILEAILPAADFAAFKLGMGLKDEDIFGRPCQVQVGLNDNGWPFIVTVMPPRRGFNPDISFLSAEGAFDGVESVG